MHIFGKFGIFGHSLLFVREFTWSKYFLPWQLFQRRFIWFRRVGKSSCSEHFVLVRRYPGHWVTAAISKLHILDVTKIVFREMFLYLLSPRNCSRISLLNRICSGLFRIWPNSRRQLQNTFWKFCFSANYLVSNDACSASRQTLADLMIRLSFPTIFSRPFSA